jgi:hypothetical protein
MLEMLTPSQESPAFVGWNGWSTTVAHVIMRAIPAIVSGHTVHVR